MNTQKSKELKFKEKVREKGHSLTIYVVAFASTLSPEQFFKNSPGTT